MKINSKIVSVPTKNRPSW